MALESVLGNRYILESSENFDEYMQILGVNAFMRKMAKTLSPIIQLKKSGDEYIWSSTSGFKTTSFGFKDGVEFDQETPDGRKVKATITIVDDSTLHEVHTDTKGKVSVIDRYFYNDSVKMVIKCENIVATRIYKLHTQSSK